MTASAPDTDDSRSLTIHTHTEQGTWVEHATATLTPTPITTPTHGCSWTADTTWPGPHAEPVDVTTLYERVALDGYHYGPAFQNLRKLWRHNDHLHAIVTLDPELTQDIDHYALHPALLDATLHPLLPNALTPPTTHNTTSPVLLPFTWTDLDIHTTGAHTLHTTLTPTNQDSWTLHATDPHGTPITTAQRITTRPHPIDAFRHVRLHTPPRNVDASHL